MDQIIRQLGNTVIIENKDTGEILATIGIQFFSIEFYETTIQIVDSSKVNDVYTIQLNELYDEALNPLNTQALALASITNFLPPGGGGGTSNLEQVLINGNNTGNNDIVIDQGQKIEYITAGGNGGLNPLPLTTTRSWALPDESGTIALKQNIATDPAVIANTAKVGITPTQASDIVTNNAKVTFPEAPNTGLEYVRKSLGWAVSTATPLAWAPPVMPLSSILTSGTSWFINDSGTGVYLSMPSGVDSRFFLNYTLVSGAGINYDGSSLALRIRARKSIAGNGYVGLILSYGFMGDGTNSATNNTILTQQNVILDAETENINFTVDLSTMLGVPGTNLLMLTVERNGQNPVSDTYNGSFEVLGLEIIKM